MIITTIHVGQKWICPFGFAKAEDAQGCIGAIYFESERGVIPVPLWTNKPPARALASFLLDQMRRAGADWLNAFVTFVYLQENPDAYGVIVGTDPLGIFIGPKNIQDGKTPLLVVPPGNPPATSSAPFSSDAILYAPSDKPIDDTDPAKSLVVEDISKLPATPAIPAVVAEHDPLPDVTPSVILD